MKLATLVISASLLAAPAFAEQCASKKDAHRINASYTHAIAGEGYTTRIGTQQTRAFMAGIRGVTTGNANAVSVAKCLATRTGGEYVSAETVDDLVEAMRRTLGCNLLF